jgi:GNAT superfamily N-acetyltransferase
VQFLGDYPLRHRIRAMAVIRFVCAGGHDRRGEDGPWSVGVQRISSASDWSALAKLGEHGAQKHPNGVASDGHSARAFTASGLLCELASRENRDIIAWFARDLTLIKDRVDDGIRGSRVKLSRLECAVECEAIGVVALAQTPTGWSIPWLLVHPDARRRGVGRMLVNTAVTHARSQGAVAVTAETLAAWGNATAFWPAVGFSTR